MDTEHHLCIDSTTDGPVAACEIFFKATDYLHSRLRAFHRNLKWVFYAWQSMSSETSHVVRNKERSGYVVSWHLLVIIFFCLLILCCRLVCPCCVNLNPNPAWGCMRAQNLTVYYHNHYIFQRLLQPMLLLHALTPPTTGGRNVETLDESAPVNLIHPVDPVRPRY